jgi:L-ascorbate metabolism protein UlaG (beta-lactamase superfamily)
VEFVFLGHAAVRAVVAGKVLLIDPFLTGNPMAAAGADSVDADYILVSHAHHDHLGDAVAIAKRTGATIISTAEVAGKCGRDGAKTHAMHVGGVRGFEFGTVRLTPAVHGSGVDGGLACGFTVSSEGRRFYHAGDTGLFGDMELLAKLEPLDLAFLPIGGNYTMGIPDAVYCVRLMRPRVVIPIHYNTWPVVQADPHDFRARVQQAVPGTEVVVLEPGEGYRLD